MRDAGFLVGEFETPLLQEMCHERSDFSTKKFLRRAGDNEVIRIADQRDLVSPLLPARRVEALRQERLQSIESPIRQRGRADASLRSAARWGDEYVFFHESRLQPLLEDDRVHGDVGQQPIVTDPVEAGLDIAFENPRGTVVVAQDLIALIERISA